MSPILTVQFEYWTGDGDESILQNPELLNAALRSFLALIRKLGSNAGGIFLRMMNQREDIIVPSKHRTRYLSVSIRMPKTPGN